MYKRKAILGLIPAGSGNEGLSKEIFLWERECCRYK